MSKKELKVKKETTPAYKDLDKINTNDIESINITDDIELIYINDDTESINLNYDPESSNATAINFIIKIDSELFLFFLNRFVIEKHSLDESYAKTEKEFISILEHFLSKKKVKKIKDIPEIYDNLFNTVKVYLLSSFMDNYVVDTLKEDDEDYEEKIKACNALIEKKSMLRDYIIAKFNAIYEEDF